MDVLRRLRVPTGDILIVEGERGRLELLSLGDYGKDANIKCDALGLSRVPERVVHQTMLPLTEKWVITISTQYGCSMGCRFCDVPKVGPGRNATLDDLLDQIRAGLSLHPEIVMSDRLNIHFARMGEPSWNPKVIECVNRIHDGLGEFNPHPVVSTMMPKGNAKLARFIEDWMAVKNVVFRGNAGLQLSINSTSEAERNEMFSGSALSLHGIADIMAGYAPVGRKITLNFALAGYKIDPDVLLRYFDPARYLVKLTPMHRTAACSDAGIVTGGVAEDYEPYAADESSLREAGYDVLVFMASEAEDRSRITCGNAILSGTEPAGGEG
jgi:23S rRNA (adenine2503-C2)-methyltransferase